MFYNSNTDTNHTIQYNTKSNHNSRTDSIAFFKSQRTQ